jgi:hypothetical protein
MDIDMDAALRGSRLPTAMFILLVVAGCDALFPCAEPPTESHGVCSPGQTTCGGGSADPVPDTRDDGATDITSFAPNAIPAGVLLNVPNEGRLHVPEDEPPTYQYNPPASGPHFESPAETGFYCEQLAEGHWVHSLEHGYIVILFDPAAPFNEVTQLALRCLLQTAPTSPAFGNRKLVVTPYAGLQHPLCLVAWNRQLYLDFYDPFAVIDFYQTYIDQGPEQEP